MAAPAGARRRDPAEGYYTPKKNDVWVLTGELRDADEPVPHLDACPSCTFAVREDKDGLEILPNPPFGIPGEQLSLHALRAALVGAVAVRPPAARRFS